MSMTRIRGMTLIELMVTVAIIGILIGLLLPGVQSAREAARRAQCICNLKSLTLAASNYVSVHGVYPFGVGGGAPPGPGRVPRWSSHSQLLPWIEQVSVFDAINFGGVAWLSDPVFGPPNQTALKTKISSFLCPSDPDCSADPYDLGHVSYRGNAGTQPYNLAADAPDGTGRNDGVFWYQSAVRIASITDGTSTTALFSERCLGSKAWPGRQSDYYLGGTNPKTCLNAGPGTAVRYAVPHELSGLRWGDGALFYSRYNHVFTPNKPSCLMGGTNDHGSPVIVTASSRHPNVVNLAIADGSVRCIMDVVAPNAWKSLGTIAGSDQVIDLGY